MFETVAGASPVIAGQIGLGEAVLGGGPGSAVCWRNTSSTRRWFAVRSDAVEPGSRVGGRAWHEL